MREMLKKLGVTRLVSEISCVVDHAKSDHAKSDHAFLLTSNVFFVLHFSVLATVSDTVS